MLSKPSPGAMLSLVQAYSATGLIDYGEFHLEKSSCFQAQEQNFCKPGSLFHQAWCEKRCGTVPYVIGHMPWW